MDTIKYLITGKYDHNDPSYQQGIKDYYESVSKSPYYAARRAESEKQEREERERMKASMLNVPISDPKNKVEKGDLVVVPVDGLESRRVTIQWKRLFKQMSEEYLVVNFENVMRGMSRKDVPVHEQLHAPSASEPGGMFISVDKINDIKSQPQKDGKYLVAVTDAFQYGQLDGEGKGRFLVLHDGSRMIFMHRFLGPQAAESLGGKFQYTASALKSFKENQADEDDDDE
ncbi:hypothetical protein MMC17_009250 [Xylographa soralifera]|nr:hypothetical protein [Xylographa soralifera]